MSQRIYNTYIKASMIELLEKHQLDSPSAPSWMLADYLLASLETATRLLVEQAEWNGGKNDFPKPVKTDDQSDIQRIPIVVTIERKNVPHLLGMLSTMEAIGKNGKQIYVSYYMDGEKSHPVFQWDPDLYTAPPSGLDLSGEPCFGVEVPGTASTD